MKRAEPSLTSLCATGTPRYRAPRWCPAMTPLAVYQRRDGAIQGCLPGPGRASLSPRHQCATRATRVRQAKRPGGGRCVTTASHALRDAGQLLLWHYFKREAIHYAWQLLTEVFELPVERLWFTVFEGDDEVPPDDEAARYWIETGAAPSGYCGLAARITSGPWATLGPVVPAQKSTSILVITSHA